VVLRGQTCLRGHLGRHGYRILAADHPSHLRHGTIFIRLESRRATRDHDVKIGMAASELANQTTGGKVRLVRDRARIEYRGRG
jgi:hypothetical protein